MNNYRLKANKIRLKRGCSIASLHYTTDPICGNTKNNPTKLQLIVLLRCIGLCPIPALFYPKKGKIGKFMKNHRIENWSL